MQTMQTNNILFAVNVIDNDAKEKDSNLRFFSEMRTDK